MEGTGVIQTVLCVAAILFTQQMSNVVLEPSGIGEVVQQGMCLRFTKIRCDSEAREQLENSRQWRDAFRPLSSLLATTGNRFEEDIYDAIRNEAHKVIEDDWKGYSEVEADSPGAYAKVENDKTIISEIEEAAEREAGSEPTLLFQAPFADEVGAFFIAGDADVIAIWPEEGNSVRVRVFDIKASWEEKTYQQIQTATYTLLLRRLTKQTDTDCIVEGGIIYRETDYLPLDPDTLPSFTLSTREDDVKRLVREGGFIDTVVKTPLEEVEYSMGSGANTGYGETYYVDSVEDSHPRLLELTRGEQKALEEAGLETVQDVAELIEPPEDTRPYKYDDPPIRDDKKDIVQQLDEEHGLGERAVVLAQKAQAKLSVLEPDHKDAFTAPFMRFIKGSGQGSLPEDDPPFNKDMAYPQGGLIRVYVNIQWDYIRERITTASARITSSNYDDTPLTFSHMIDRIPDDESEQDADERALLHKFASDVFDACQMMGTLSGQPDEAPIHFYFYTGSEHDALVERLREHNGETEDISALRDLLGMRSGIDQQMVSILKPELESRLATKRPLQNILVAKDDSYMKDGKEGKLRHNDWYHPREDGSKVNLKEAFKRGVFDYSTPYWRDGNGDITFERPDSDKDPDGFYPASPKHDAQLPVEYVWGCEEIDRFTEDWTDSNRQKHIIKSYRWVSNSEKKRIKKSDIKAMSKKFSHALHHIERSIKFKNTDIEKKPIDLDSLHEFTLGNADLQTGCMEYLDLEYESTYEDKLSHYAKPIRQRILTGKSVPVYIKESEKSGPLLRVKAEVMYEDFGFENPKRVAESCRYAGSDGSAGKNVLATPIELNGDWSTSVNPDNIFHSVPLSVVDFDTETGEVELMGFPNGSAKVDKYVSWHRNFTLDPSEEGQFTKLFASGETFILDPSSDDLTANRSCLALENLGTNGVYQKMTSLLSGDQTPLKSSMFTKNGFGPYLSWLETEYPIEPNKQQKEFIKEDAAISLLQGPPGTGKTSGSIALAVLGRLCQSEANDTPLRGLVTGSSNKSVDEVLEDVSKALTTYRERDTKPDFPSLDDVLLVRLTSEKPDDPLENVEYVNYHEDSGDLDNIWTRLNKNETGGGRQAGIGEYSSSSGEAHVIVFSTPSRTYGLAGKLPMDNQVPDEQDKVTYAYEQGLDLFDAIVVDEASMMPLPEFFMVGAFASKRSQLLIAGDHRQMPPVQSHDWKEETRRTIEETIPYLSVLNYYRFLRGDTVDSISENAQVESPEVPIPMAQLEETYRCHEDVADFLSEWMYKKDGIDYISDETDLIPSVSVDSGIKGVKAALDADAPLTVIVHQDTKSRQSNIVEAQISKALSENVPKSESVGMVTPHNAQKGLLNSMCSNVQVDTVERFQGGQRDMMIVNATVSDPDYIEAEEDFILNPNRLNVAISRMKKKLVVVVPQSLFEMIPSDVDSYENASIWKGLYREACSDAPVWDGTLDEFTGGAFTEGETEVAVYHSNSTPTK